ncbi:MAG: hypothetical protein QXU18_12390 [Thermoplasmatales archaeon]
MEGLKIKEVCNKINSVPTMLAVIRLGRFEKVVLTHASYDPKADEGTLTFYHGPLECVYGITRLPDGVHSQTEEWVKKLTFRGEVDRVEQVVPYLTEYDFTKPDDMPVWAVEMWAGSQKLRIKK